MIILHISAECYPMAKAGGLADVVGALPKYQNKLGHDAKVIMPMHRTRFLYDNDWEVVHKDSFQMGEAHYDFTIIRETSFHLGFELYCVDINGLLDRERIYSYDDDDERWMAFQIAVLEWIKKWEYLPDVVNVHDFHAGLIPFMMQQCYSYSHLSQIKTVLTIHNAQYQGWMSWDKGSYLPAWNTWRWGLLDWNDMINPLAAAVKCAHKVNTVSPSYMDELRQNANGLQDLFNYETGKCSGILNGIDYEVWDPLTDTLILDNYSFEDVEAGKKLNKQQLCREQGFDPEKPLFVFIGRLVNDKGADLLPDAIAKMYAYNPADFSFLILGSGDPGIEFSLSDLNDEWVGYYNSRIEFNEKLSHSMYASADFLVMPSRVEPCGLNQMYALRYGTIPIVRRTGGLKDTVQDFGEYGGFGICFNEAGVMDIVHSMNRALELYHDKPKFEEIRKRIMTFNNSWENSAQKYIDLYNAI